MSARLAGLLGIDVPIIQGPFGGGLSSIPLAAAVSGAGGLGSFGAHHLDADAITALVADLKSAVPGGRPFNVNLWVPHPHEADLRPASADLDRLRPLYERLGMPAPTSYTPPPAFDDQIDALLAAQPPVISFVMGVPSADVVTEARRRGRVVPVSGSPPRSGFGRVVTACCGWSERSRTQRWVRCVCSASTTSRSNEDITTALF